MQQLKIGDFDIPQELTAEMLTKLQAVVFIDDRVFGTFSASAVDNNGVITSQIDPLDAIVLSILQQDPSFMKGEHKKMEIHHNEDNSLLSKVK